MIPYTTMNIFQSILEILLFVFVLITCFFLPGKFLNSLLNLKLRFLEDLFFSTVIGMMLFTLIIYISSWLRLEIIVLPILLLIDFLVIRKEKWLLIKFENKHIWPILIIIFLSIIFSVHMLSMGVFGDSIAYRKDDLWHLALINELKVNFPPDNPGFAGIPLRGYHFFYNLLLAKINNIFHISSLSLYFHFFPPLIAFLWGMGVYSLMYIWSKNIKVALWAVFLTLFGGSFAFILNLQGHNGLSIDSAFGISQPATSLINPPYAISIVIVVAVLFALYQYLSTRKYKWLVPLVLCLGLVSMFKVYAGMILLSSMLLLVVVELLMRRVLLFFALFISGILFLATYWVFRDPSSTLIFFPLWAPHKVLLDNMTWYGYEEKHYTYSRLGVIRGLIKIELYGLYIFIFGNLGTRLFGLLFLPLSLLKKWKFPSTFALVVFIMMLISILTPLFFIQSGQVFEIIQMAWYFLFFSSLFAAFGFAILFDFRYSRIVKLVLIVAILLITLPSAYENYKGYFERRLSFKRDSLSDPYYKAMSFLSLQGDYNSTVVEIPPKYIQANDSDLTTWFLSSTPAIVAFSNKRSFFNNENIIFYGIDLNQRIKFLKKIILINKISSTAPDFERLQIEVMKGIKENKISYVFSPYSLPSFISIKPIHELYRNEKYVIYKVN